MQKGYAKYLLSSIICLSDLPGLIASLVQKNMLMSKINKSIESSMKICLNQVAKYFCEHAFRIANKLGPVLFLCLLCKRNLKSKACRYTVRFTRTLKLELGEIYGNLTWSRANLYSHRILEMTNLLPLRPFAKYSHVNW